MYLWNLYFSIVSGARNERVTFVGKPQIKIFSFENEKQCYIMQYLIRQSFEGYCCESEFIASRCKEPPMGAPPPRTPLQMALLQTVKIDRVVNFDRCQAGQNWPGFVSPLPFIEKNWNFKSTLWTV